MKTIQFIAGLTATVLALLCSCATPKTQEADMRGPMSYDVELDVGFDASIEQVTAALKAEGFGIITRIDLHTTFQEKLGVEMAPHTILGACNPNLAHRAVTSTPEAALMLPCNVTVQQLGGQRVKVRIVSPAAMMFGTGFDDDPTLREVEGEAQARLMRVAEALRG